MVMATTAKASAERCFHHVGAAHCVRSKFQFGSNCFLPKSLKHWVRSGTSHLYPHILVARRGISTTQQHASLKDAQSSTFDGKDLFDLNLEDTGAIFKAKGTSDLAFALFILKLCMQRRLVEYGPRMLDLLHRCGVSQPAYWLIRLTFFRHFCAGETIEEVDDSVAQFKRGGVRPIFDYSVEDTFDPAGWRDNADHLISKIKLYSQQHGETVKFVPLKVTSLCSPALLERMTALIFHNDDGSLAWLDGEIYPKSSAFTSLSHQIPSSFSSDEEKCLREALERLRAICHESKACGYSLLFDAEQTHRQPAINHFARKLAKEFNKDKKAVVFNTFQLYLKDNTINLQREIENAQRENYMLGAKCVRGAYLVAETKKAQECGHPLPIHSSKEKTDEAYNMGISLALSHLSHTSLVIASHNPSSVRVALSQMRRLGVSRNDERVHFAQLMGICDSITLSLGSKGFNVHKLMPYGPILNVMPYLIRRLEENSSIFGGSHHERKLLWKELERRRFGLRRSC